MAHFPNEGPGRNLFTITVFLLTLSWIIVIIRVLVRWRIRSFGVDDVLMCVGLVFYTLACQATITMTFYGVGDVLKNMTSQQDIVSAQKWSFFFQFWYCLGTIPIKASICVTLMRISYRPIHRYVLYFVVFLTAFGALWSDIAILANCKPVSATWDTSKGHCSSPKKTLLPASYVLSTTSIASDWICAAMPVVLLWRVRLMKGVKASLVVVLALGALASTATIIRLANVVYYTRHPEEFLQELGSGAMWSIVESGVGLTAGSLPTLRPLMKRIPGCAGSVEEMTPSSGTGRTSRGYPPGLQRLPSFKLDNLPHNSSNTNCTGWAAAGDTQDQKSAAANEGESTSGSRMHIVLENQVHIEGDGASRALPPQGR
ncbi:hypothetical protein HDK90DRAFT_103929 [Phyllosticta capitalensis]|uniref:Rhodopsin domain-containing protein n=1 Tax=Phyllosticta capitalensis TaxID=121624 RepID=A0ABR1YA31_9PEZI